MHFLLSHFFLLLGGWMDVYLFGFVVLVQLVLTN